ncbi:dihydrofolate reductase family protein [Nocardioides sp. KIGAM211]|uniref:Dihydrofolate reductase family protein n=1 Tax=Nocardioides luti TaxID=2761101 RepID=A0A7X0V9L9_9ACTN|nr:dihydrofolate reductase family protein [Nocardioides luti]
MRKVVSWHFVSADGVAEDPDRFFTTWDDETDVRSNEVIATQDTVVLGRRTHDEWAPFWPTSDIEPFATFINAVTKYVATSTPLGHDWTNTHVIEGDLADAVRHLRAQPGGDIGVHASISVTRALITAGLVDEIRMVVMPTVIGSGRSLLAGLPELKLEMLGCETTPAGHLLLDYRVRPAA